MITYPIGKVTAYLGEDLRDRGYVSLEVSVYFNSESEKWILSFGSPYEYDLEGLFKNSMPRLFQDSQHDFCIDIGRELFVPNEKMQEWMFKASAVAGVIDRGG